MRIAFITPHLSTGGMPEYLRRSIELLDRKEHEVLLIEMRTEKTLDAIRKRVLDLEGIELFSAEKSPFNAIEKIESFDPDVIHFSEPSEQTMDPNFLDRLYKKDRTWKIFETCHDSSYPLPSKKFFPDKFLLVSPFQVKMMLDLGVPAELVQYDVPPMEMSNKSLTLKKLGLDSNKKHVFQFGIFSPRKNQRETIRIASLMIEEPVQFHFVGNTADSYSYYWKPLLENMPKNCKFWGEHKDVQKFYSVADLVIFPSIELIDDKETNPLVIKEAIAYGIPLLLKDTPVYLGMYPENDRLFHMGNTDYENSLLINRIIDIKQNKKMFSLNFKKEDNTLEITSNAPIGKSVIAVKDRDSEATIYSFDVDFNMPNSTWWCKPIPINHYDFFNSPDFSGFLVKIFNADKSKVLDEVVLEFKEPMIKRKIPGLHDFEPVFVNYEQFFVKRIYDGLFAGENIKTVLDVGASVGLFTQWVLDRFGEYTPVIAFEPNPTAIEGFKAVHGRRGNVNLYEAAAAGEEGEIELGINPENSTISSINMETSNKIKVKALTIKSAMDLQGWESADLLKIDIEGAEYEIFEKMEHFPFRYILLEFHENTGQLDGVISKLEKEGYEIEIRKEDTRYKGSAADYKGLVIAKSSLKTINDKQVQLREMGD